ncbi:hypothetical protein ABW21_db0208202 [Orbilia brochopaga]|nr:hypothetical protein ABW21_db0208202 [Drechslerella brochopaga]
MEISRVCRGRKQLWDHSSVSTSPQTPSREDREKGQKQYKLEAFNDFVVVTIWIQWVREERIISDLLCGNNELECHKHFGKTDSEANEPRLTI